MKLYYALILSVIFMAFLGGYLVLLLQGTQVASEEEVLAIRDLKEEFHRQVKPLFKFNLKAIYHLKDQYELIDSVYVSARNQSVVAFFGAGQANCEKGVFSALNFLNSVKFWFWDEYRCGRRSALPLDFFQRAPFVHSSGYSYAYLASHLNRQSSYETARWINSHLNFFHMSELVGLQEEVGELSGIYGIFADMGKESVLGVTKGEISVLSEDLFLDRIKDQSLKVGLSYRSYSRARFEHYLRKTPYAVDEFRPGEGCFYLEGQVCWRAKKRRLLDQASISSLLLLAAILITIGIVVWLLFTRLRAQRMEDDRKKLALHVLTHELRTPITSMLLQVEQLKKNFDKIDPEVQEPFLRMADDVYRLQRLTEVSRKYLKVHQKKELVDFNWAEVPSLNDYFLNTLEGFQKGVDYRPLENDQGYVLDVYWTSVVLRNLVENAHRHGKAPVKVTLGMNSKGLEISVEDEGVCVFKELSQMTEAFVKGDASQGTGLGLNIVIRIVGEMGGKVEFESSPTKFTIRLRRMLVKAIPG